MTAAFRTRHPGVAVRIVNGTSSELAEMVKDHRTDFCLISRRDGLPVWLPIRQDELLVLVPKSNPLAGMDAVAALVVYYPEWVSSFDDSSYLSKK
jgi:DNA-binding transcriptional LysR family regulator